MVRQRFWPIVVLSISTAILILALLVYTLWQDHANRIADAKSNALFIADIVASQTQSTIAELEKMLNGISLELRRGHLKVDTPRNEKVEEYLKDLRSSYKNLMDILILNADGEIVQWTGEGSPPTVTDRAYTRAHLDNNASGLFVGEPLLSKVHKGQWFFAISEAVRDGGGRLRNIVVAIVGIELFRSQFADIELPTEESSLGLITKSGNLITRKPGHDKYVGAHVDEAARIWQGRNKSLEGDLEIESPMDHVDRIVGFRLLDEYGISAYSSIAREVLLQGWYRLVTIAVVILVSVVVVLVFFSADIYLVQRRVAAQQQKLVSLARTDELTGLYNRRYVMELFKSEYGRAKRYGTPLSLLIADIDHFKSINDSFGHDCGDAALKQVAEIMRRVNRNETVTGRYGGEEFLVLLPMTTQAQAISAAERLRMTVEAEPFAIGEHRINLTLSIGVAGCNLQPDCVYAAIKKADEALYRAKGEGRNRVIAAG